MYPYLNAAKFPLQQTPGHAGRTLSQTQIIKQSLESNSTGFYSSRTYKEKNRQTGLHKKLKDFLKKKTKNKQNQKKPTQYQHKRQ